jgi:excisionase family DNA binding protein
MPDRLHEDRIAELRASIIDGRMVRGMIDERPDPRWLTIAEARKYLGTSREAFRRLRAAGKLPTVKRFGRKLMFDRAGLEAAIRGCQKKRRAER